MSEQTAMDERQREPHPGVWRQLTAVYRGLSTAQRVSLGLAVIALGAGFTWVSMNRSGAAVIPLLDGRELAGRELASARKQLTSAGLTRFQVVDGRILAPATDAARYNAVLSENESAGTGWAGAWQEANAALSPFATGRQQHDAQEIARARLISQLLAQLPDVAQAEIVWDEEPRIGWRQPPRVRATVYLQPRARREITLDIVEAVKQAVAGSKAHLDPEDIVVLDLHRMVAWGTGAGGDETTADQQRLAVLTAAYRQRIEEALTDIEGARVAVVVEPAPVGVPSAPAAGPVQAFPRSIAGGESPAPGSPAPPASKSNSAAGGPNLKLEVPRFIAEPPRESTAGRAVETAAMNPDAPPPAPEPAASDRVSVTISLAPEYLRLQAEQHQSAAAFSRMSTVQQQALLADVERAVARRVRERIAAIIPGGTLDERLALVQVIPEMAYVAGAVDAAPETASQTVESTSTPDTKQYARWLIAGMIVCLAAWLLYQMARAVSAWWREWSSSSRLRRETPAAESMAPIDRHAAHQTTYRRTAGPSIAPVSSAAPGTIPERVADLIALMDDEDADRWTHDVADESPQVIAALLRRLPPERVAGVLSAVPADVQSEILMQLAGRDAASIMPIAEPVRRNGGTRPGEAAVSNVVPRRRRWFQRWRSGSSRGIGAGGRETESMPIEDVSDLDQITELDSAELRTRYADLPVETWSTALMGASSAFRVRLLSALPAGDAAALRQALTRHRPARLDDIETAQSQVLALLNGHPIAAVESR